MKRLTRGGLLALALPTLYGAILLLVPTPGGAALLDFGAKIRGARGHVGGVLG